MDGAVVGAGSLWPTPIRDLDSRFLFCLQHETEFSALLCIFFSFRSALSCVCVCDGSIVIVLATKGICRCCFVMFIILFWWFFWELLCEYQTFGSLFLRFITQFVSCFFFFLHGYGL
jgi:hypothetical protein